MDTFNLSNREYQLISRLVYDRFGISLGEQKRNLIVGRLQGALRTGGFKSFSEYYRHVVEDFTGRALLELVDRISTNHTFFFREKDHYDFLTSRVMPQLEEPEKKGSRDIRIWSAGCSSGEEPYTLAMVLDQYFSSPISNVDIGILATDISVSALEKAVAGVYTSGQMSEAPLLYRQKYFTALGDGRWAVKPDIKQLVFFRRLNLMREEYPFKGRFQVIFCRNVMIYFDEATRQGLLSRFHRYIEPGGYLFIGHSESLGRSNGLFRFIKPAVYQRI